MGLSISRSFDPSGPANAGFTGMGDWAGPGGGAPPGYTMDIAHSNLGYNPAIVAAHAPGNMPAVNTGNEFAPTSGLNPFNQNPYNIDNITQPASGFVSTLTGPEFFGLQPGQFNPFNSNPYNIDNINTPTVSPFGGYPNQIGVSNAPWINPFGSMFGGTGFPNQYGPDN